MLFDREELSILVVSVSDKIYDIFIDLTKDRFHSDMYRASSISEAKRMTLLQDFDIVVINAPLKDESGIDFAVNTATENATGVLLLISNEYYEQVLDKVMAYGVLTVSKPISRQVLYESFNLLVATNSRIKKVEKNNEKLTAKMEEVRIVNRAKWILIENLGLSEEEAHRIIEKQAMDERQSKREVAETIIRTYGTEK
ncbi:MAG: ANTAR domain-containing protein [Clostridia bacterium]|nr:ANTAR domain-containing protein [Clostridia bacterium]MBQ7752003.1 ANTAR domain-containing protein [Clostridia bacterium]